MTQPPIYGGVNGVNGIRSELIVLRDPNQLGEWIAQTEYLAQQLGCTAHLRGGTALPPLSSSAPPGTTNMGAGPLPVMTINDFVLESQAEAALRLITSTVGSPIYAYARVLGFQSFGGKSPSDLYRCVMMAASRIHVVHRGNHTDDEAARMVHEWHHADHRAYPRQVRFEGAMEWLEKMIRRRHEHGDLSMAPTVDVMDRKRADREYLRRYEQGRRHQQQQQQQQVSLQQLRQGQYQQNQGPSQQHQDPRAGSLYAPPAEGNDDASSASRQELATVLYGSRVTAESLNRPY